MNHSPCDICGTYVVVVRTSIRWDVLFQTKASYVYKGTRPPLYELCSYLFLLLGLFLLSYDRKSVAVSIQRRREIWILNLIYFEYWIVMKREWKKKNVFHPCHHMCSRTQIETQRIRVWWLVEREFGIRATFHRAWSRTAASLRPAVWCVQSSAQVDCFLLQSRSALKKKKKLNWN